MKKVREYLKSAEEGFERDKLDHAEKLACAAVVILEQSGIRTLETSLALAKAHRIHAGVLVRKGVAHGALLAAQTACSLLLERDEGEEFIRALYFLGVAQTMCGNCEQAFRILNEVHDRCERINFGLLLADCRLAIGHVHFRLFEYANAELWYERAVAIYRAMENEEGVSKATGCLGTVYFQYGKIQEALACHAAAYIAAERSGSQYWMLIHEMNRGLVLIGVAEYAEALESFKKSTVLARTLNLLINVARLEGNTSLAYRRLRDYEAALQHGYASIEAFVQCGVKASEAIQRTNLAEIHQDVSRHHDAAEQLQTAGEMFSQMNMREHQIWCLTLSMKSYIKLDMDDKAFLISEEIRQYIENTPYDIMAVEVFLEMAAFALMKGKPWYNPEEARRYVELANDEHQIRANPFLGERFYSLQAQVLEATGDWEGCAKSLQELQSIREIVANVEIKVQIDRFKWKRRLEEEQSLKQQAELDVASRSAEVKRINSELRRKNILFDEILRNMHSLRSFVKPSGMQILDDIEDIVKRNLSVAKPREAERNSNDLDIENAVLACLSRYPALTSSEARILTLIGMKLTTATIAATLHISLRTVEFHRLNIRKKLRLRASDDLARLDDAGK
jgi:DNA-binding CsgD family transcriptional regulator/tetratricopeptide (TPR) repeat protein